MVPFVYSEAQVVLPPKLSSCPKLFNDKTMVIFFFFFAKGKNTTILYHVNGGVPDITIYKRRDFKMGLSWRAETVSQVNWIFVF